MGTTTPSVNTFAIFGWKQPAEDVITSAVG